VTRHRAGAAPVTAPAVLVAMVLVAMVLAACGSSPAAEADATTTTVAGDPVPVDVAAPPIIPDLELTPLATHDPAWGAMKGAADRLYVEREGSEDQYRIARLDPETGAIAAERDLGGIAKWTPTDHGLVVVEVSQHVVRVLDPDTLEDRHRIELPEDMRVFVAHDTPQGDPFWLGVRQYDVDQIAGIYTRMGAVQVDLERGEVGRFVELPTCGASAVVQPDDGHLVAGLSCVHQFAVADLVTGEVTTSGSFGVLPHLMTLDGVVWARFKTLGYLARMTSGSDGAEILDLNADGPTFEDVTPLIGRGDGVWTVGVTADPETDRVLHRIDPETFTVTGRAHFNGSLAFAGDLGYTLLQGELSTFEPASVTEAPPREVVRPEPGAPAAATPDSDEEQEVIDVAMSLMDPAVDNDEVLPHLGGDEDLTAIRSALVELADAAYPGVRPRVTAVSVDGDRASVGYVFLVDDVVAFVPFTAVFERRDGTWVITRDSVCVIAQEAAVPGC